MPIDPYIARGGPRFDVTNTLTQVSALRQRDRALDQDAASNALMRERFAYGQQQDALAQQQQAAEDEEDRQLEAAWAARDWAAANAIDPVSTMGYQMKLQEWEQRQKGPSPITAQNIDGATFYLQDDKVIGSRMPQTPQQQTPEAFSDYTDAEGNVYLIGNRGTIRPTQLRGAGKAAPTGLEPMAAESRKQDAENVLSSISDAEGMAGTLTTGLVGKVMGDVAGTTAYDLRAAVDTIKANIGFDRLARMREESKTGGALGQVTERELALLQATIDSLDANQSEKQLRVALTRVRGQYERAMQAYERMLQQGAAPTPTGGLPPVEQRIQGYYGTGK